MVADDETWFELHSVLDDNNNNVLISNDDEGITHVFLGSEVGDDDDSVWSAFGSCPSSPGLGDDTNSDDGWIEQQRLLQWSDDDDDDSGEDEFEE